MDIRTSPLVQMEGEAKRPTRWWLAWIVTAVLIVAVGGIGGAIGSPILGGPEKQDALYQFQEFFTFGATLLGLFLWVRFKEGRPFSSLGFRGKGAVGKFLLGVLIGAAMMTVGVLVPWAMGQYAPDVSAHTNYGTAALKYLLPLIVVFILQASTEEALTRGYMLQVSGRQLPAWVAVLGTSFFFAAIHLDFHPIPLINITLYAVFASFVALGAGNLWLICGLHAGWNYFQGNFYGLPVSGNAEANSLLRFGPTDGSSDLITGGSFGVEASIIGTVILGVATVIAFAYYRRQEAARSANRVAATEAA